MSSLQGSGRRIARWAASLCVLVSLSVACSSDGNDDGARGEGGDASDPADVATDERIQTLEAELDASNSRWLASVAVSAQYSPTVSRLLAVDALRRSPTVEAWSALGQLLFADPRRPAELIEAPHGAAVNVVRFSPDSTLLATGADDGVVRLFVAGSDEVVATMGHDASVVALAFADQAPLFATAGHDGRAIVWDLEGREVTTVSHTEQVNDVAISADAGTTVTASHDGTARISTASGVVELSHAGPVWSADVTADGSVVATGAETDEGGVTTLWTSDGAQIASFQHDAAAVAVRFSPDDTHLFAASAGSVQHLIEIDSATSVSMPAEAARPGVPVTGVQWNHDGTEVATYSLAGIFRVQSPDGGLLGRLDHAGGERGIGYDPTGSWAAAGSGDFAFSFGMVGVWDLPAAAKLVEINTGGPVESVAVSPDGSWVAAGFRFADGSEIDGGLVQFPGRDHWVDLACEGNEGIIGDSMWVELVGPDEPFVPGCPGVEAPPADESGG